MLLCLQLGCEAKGPAQPGLRDFGARTEDSGAELPDAGEPVPRDAALLGSDAGTLDAVEAPDVEALLDASAEPDAAVAADSGFGSDSGFAFDAGFASDAGFAFDASIPSCTWNGMALHDDPAIDLLRWCDRNNAPVVIVNPNFSGENWLPGCGGQINVIMTICGADSYFAGEIYAERLKFQRGLDPAIYGDVSYRISYDTRDSMAGFDAYNGFLMTVSDVPGDLSGTFSGGIPDNLVNCARLNGAPAGSIDIRDVRQSAAASPFACALTAGQNYYVNIKATHPACNASVHCSVIVRDFVPGSGRPERH